MKQLFLALSFATVLVTMGRAQEGSISLYVSKATGEASKHSGSYDKSTDEYESSNITLTTTGPITYSINPSELSIGPNESKSWTGDITVDVSQAPEPGTSAQATLKATGTYQYSRPSDEGGSGSVISTHTCKKCPSHPDGGSHDVVEEQVNEQMAFVVYSLKADIEGDDLACKGSKLKLKAKGYPDGGSYEWKSLDPSKASVQGSGAEATVSSVGNSIGTARIQVTYTMGGVKHEETKEVTFFDLKVKLTPASVCDGKDVKVTLTPVPANLDVEKVKACLTDLKIGYKTKTPFKGNILGKAEIDFSEPDANLEATAESVFWYANDNVGCDPASKYEIWAEAGCACGSGTLKSASQDLTVTAGDGKCVNGHANVEIALPPNLGNPGYTNMQLDSASGLITFTTPAGPYPDITVQLRKTGNNNTWTIEARYKVGQFNLRGLTKGNVTDKKSQFFEPVEMEESIHLEQFKGNTDIQELKALLDASEVIKNVNAIIRPLPFNKNQYSVAFVGAYVKDAWLKVFLPEVQKEVNEFNNVTAGWAQNIRCRLEEEAKNKVKAKYPKLYVLEYPCAYKKCVK